MTDKDIKENQSACESSSASEQIVLTEDVSVYTLYLANIPQQKSEEILKNEFTRFGEVKSVVLHRKRKNARNDTSIYRYGFVIFENAESTARALNYFEKLNKDGASRRLMKVRAAYTRKQPFIAQKHSDFESIDSANNDEERCMTILDLNQDCLQHAFSYLNPVERLIVSLACGRFKNISETLINSNTIFNLNDMKHLTLMQSRELLKQFGRRIKRIRLEGLYDTWRYHLKFIQKYCHNLEELSFVGTKNQRINFENYRKVLAASKKIKVLQLEYVGVTDKICSEIAAYSHLERLNLTENVKITGKHLNKLENLIELNLMNCDSIQSDAFVNICLGMKLKTLNIEYCSQLNDAAFEVMIRTQYKLERIMMCTYYQARNIHIVGHLTNLKHIGINYIYGSHHLANAILKEVAENRKGQLESLTIVYNKYNCPAEHISVEQILEFPNLKELGLHCDLWLDDNYLIKIANKCSKLADVNINESNYTVEGILAFVSALKQLRHLNISFCCCQLNAGVYCRILNIVRERNSIPLTLYVDEAKIEPSFLQTEQYNKSKELLTLKFIDS